MLYLHLRIKNKEHFFNGWQRFGDNNISSKGFENNPKINQIIVKKCKNKNIQKKRLISFKLRNIKLHSVSKDHLTYLKSVFPPQHMNSTSKSITKSPTLPQLLKSTLKRY